MEQNNKNVVAIESQPKNEEPAKKAPLFSIKVKPSLRTGAQLVMEQCCIR